MQDARLRCLDMEILKGGTRAAWLQIASWFAGLRRSKRPLVFSKAGGEMRCHMAQDLESRGEVARTGHAHIIVLRRPLCLGS